MLAEMRWTLILAAASAAAPASAQTAPAVLPAPVPMAGWHPAAAYVTPGQDEPGYRAWYAGAAWRPVYVKAFNDYLVGAGVGGVVPTWQLLRTASSWQRCLAQPFEVPPTSEWPRIVQTLRYVREQVIPYVGAVEPVSAYRNPLLNVCAGGAPESAHKHYSAIDMVPLRPTNREELMRRLCAVHAQRGSEYGVGLGFYAFLRFHVDTMKFRRWGSDPALPDCPPLIRPEDHASVALPPPAEATAPAAGPLDLPIPPLSTDPGSRSN